MTTHSISNVGIPILLNQPANWYVSPFFLRSQVSLVLLPTCHAMHATTRFARLVPRDSDQSYWMLSGILHALPVDVHLRQSRQRRFQFGKPWVSFRHPGSVRNDHSVWGEVPIQPKGLEHCVQCDT